MVWDGTTPRYRPWGWDLHFQYCLQPTKILTTYLDPKCTVICKYIFVCDFNIARISNFKICIPFYKNMQKFGNSVKRTNDLHSFVNPQRNILRQKATINHDWLIDWCFTSTLAVVQIILYRCVNKFYKVIFSTTKSLDILYCYSLF